MLVSTNIKQHSLLPSYEYLDASVVDSLNRFQVQRYRNAISNLEKEERNVHGYKTYFYNLSAKGWFPWNSSFSTFRRLLFYKSRLEPIKSPNLFVAYCIDQFALNNPMNPYQQWRRYWKQISNNKIFYRKSWKHTISND